MGIETSCVFHISDVAVAVSRVGDGLVASVGEDDVVGAGSFSVAIALFRVAHVNVGVAVLDVIGEAVRLSSLVVNLVEKGKLVSEICI